MTEPVDLADVLRTQTTPTARTPQPRAVPRSATLERPSELPGSEPAEQPPLTLQPLRRLREGIAVLRVVRSVTGDGSEQFTLSGDCPELPLDDTVSDRHGRPELALADLVREKGGERPAEIVVRMKSWSRNKFELSRWLGELRDRFGDELRLVIEDHTAWEIPWELFWLPPEAGSAHPGGWLGSLVPTARQVILPAADHQPDPIPAYSPAACSGDVIAFIAEDMSADEAVLRRYGAHRYDKMNHLLDRLDEDLGGLGLVYVGSHGRYAKSATDFTLAGVSVFKLEDGPKEALKRSATLVFLNACHSMRAVRDPRNNDVPRSFAAVFLQARARGVLGSAGLVDRDEANLVASDLLRRLEDPAVSVSVALRDLRAVQAGRQAALGRDGAETAEGEQVLWAFLDSFTYHYIGHPDTSLAVRKAEDG